MMNDSNRKPDQIEKLGKVYFVGAGPADPELLTIKGLRVLKRAQTVIYDALIGPGIYHMIPRTAEKIPVGKRAGRHSAKQEEINQLILEQAQMGRLVVRLKGGDPFLFGRGGEELELLVRHQIPYEIVPGVPSALAVPAYAGIPVTYRGMSSGVHILTGHKKQDEPLDMDFQALLRAGGTYVFLMGMSALHEIVSGFLQAGMSPDTPAAVIEQGTGARHRSVSSDLAQLEEEVCQRNLKAPAVIVIGKTAACGRRYAWREKLPLSGSRIVVTRPRTRSKAFAQTLQQLGAEVIEMPTIDTQIRNCEEQLREILSEILKYEYMVFTSPAGVDYFFELLDRMEMDVRCIGSVKLAVIGNATKEALKKRGLRPKLMPKRYNSAALGNLIHESAAEGSRVLLLRSAMGNPELVNIIQGDKQIKVTDLAIYDTIYTKPCNVQKQPDMEYEDNSCMKQMIDQGMIDMVMFTSASAVRGFVQLTEGADYTKMCAVCIGQMTADQALAFGMRVHIAETETVESMAEKAVQLSEKRRQTGWN